MSRLPNFARALARAAFGSMPRRTYSSTRSCMWCAISSSMSRSRARRRRLHSDNEPQRLMRRSIQGRQYRLRVLAEATGLVGQRILPRPGQLIESSPAVGIGTAPIGAQ